MPLDPSIPLQTQQQPTGLQQLAQPIQTAAGLLSLRQNQMQLGANQAISNAYAQSIDPTTGQVDFGKLQSIAAQNGAGAFLPQFMGQIAQQRNSQLQYDTGKLDLALKQQQGIRGMIGSLALDPDVGKSDMSSKIVGQISDAVQSGLLPIDQGIREIKSIPGDAQGQAAWIQNHLINSLSGEAKLQAMLPQGGVVNAGGQQFFTNRDPLTGKVQLVGGVSNTLSPEAASQNVDIIDPNTGAHYAITKAQQLAGQTSGDGRYPGQGNSAAPGGIQTALSPSDQAANSEVGLGSGKQLVSDQSYVNGSSGRLFQLGKALSGLQGATTGKGSDALNSIKSYLQTAGIPGVDPQKISNYDEANKYLTQYATSQAGQIGHGTDHQLAAILSGNASTSISNLAAQDVVRANIGIERMRQAQVDAFNQSGLPASQYQKFSSTWNQGADPRVFVWDQLAQDKKQAAYDSMTPVQRQKFSAMYKQAAQNGWLAGQ